MTADAKVGLLLGLLFIALIAFLINGFPSFLKSATAEDVVKTTSIVAPSGPSLVIDQGVSETVHRLGSGIPLRVTETPQEVIVLDSGVPAPSSAAAAETPAAPQPATIPPAAEQVTPLPAPAPRSTPAAQTHVVERGETLASIAQRYYGAEQGNRRAVIQMLYEANQHVLASPDRVVVGNTLTIPPLKDAAPAPTETLLRRFSNMFERSAAVPETTRPTAPRTTEYVVQPGDSLWKIAEKTLGDGRKFETLMELNKDRLKSPNDVVAGMKLVVPAP